LVDLAGSESIMRVQANDAASGSCLHVP